MKRYLLTIFFLLAFVGSAWAYTETFYVREDGDGSTPKVGCTSSGSWDMDDLDNATNWDIDDEVDTKLGLNDQVIICDDGGTFRPSGQLSYFDTHGSGTSGNPITITGESGGSPVISGANLLASWTQHEGASLVTDGGLETWTTATDLTNWTENIAGSSSVNRESTEVQVGTYAMRGDVDASNSLAEIAQTITLAAATTYNIRYWYWSTGDEATEGVSVEIQEEFGDYEKSYDVDHNAVGSYTQVDTTFVSDDAGNYTLRFKRYFTDDGFSFYVDGIEITLDTANVWYNTDLSNDPNIVWLDDMAYNEAVSCSAINSTNRWYWDSGTPQLCVYGTSDPSSFYSVSGVQAPVFITALYCDDNWLIIEDLTFTYARTNTVQLGGAQNNILDNITIIGSGSNSILKLDGEADSNTIKNLTLSGNNPYSANDGIKIEESGGQPSGNTFRSNTIKNSSHTSFNLLNAASNIIEKNEIYQDSNVYGRCIEIKGEIDTGSNIVRYNYFHDCEAGSQSDGSNQFAGLAQEIYGNIFSGNAEYAVLFADWTEGSFNWIAKNILFYNNTIYGNSEAGIYHSLDDATSIGNLCKNNIILANDTDNNYQVEINSSAVVGNITFSYNLIYDSDTSSTIYDGSTTRTVAYMDSNVASWSNHPTASDPLMIDPANDDFAPLPSSPACDAGTDLSDYYIDYDGHDQRSYGTGIDIGAKVCRKNIRFGGE